MSQILGNTGQNTLAPAAAQARDPVSLMSLVSGPVSLASYSLPCQHARASAQFSACAGCSESICVLGQVGLYGSLRPEPTHAG